MLTAKLTVPLPCRAWGSGGPSIVLGVLLGAPSLVGTGEGLWMLSPTSPAASSPAAKRAPESCVPGGECPSEPCTHWGSPQALLAPGVAMGAL